MVDPTLRSRLGAVTVPTLVIWGDSDRIVTSDYGRAYAEAIPGAEFRLLPDTGHLPQLETPDQVIAALRAFSSTAGSR
jgi:pimeloyl-ACP methyl ester carboxylesterase